MFMSTITMTDGDFTHLDGEHVDSLEHAVEQIELFTRHLDNPFMMLQTSRAQATPRDYTIKITFAMRAEAEKFLDDFFGGLSEDEVNDYIQD